jgi:small subunit ribosomal protein S21
MIIIKRNEKDSIDTMLKRYKRKTKRIKQVQSIRDRKEYEKPSSVKRKQKLKAIYKQKLRSEQEKNS